MLNYDHLFLSLAENAGSVFTPGPRPINSKAHHMAAAGHIHWVTWDVCMYCVACTLVDILCEEEGRLNTSTQPLLQDILLVAEDDLATFQLAREPPPNLTQPPFPWWEEQRLTHIKVEPLTDILHWTFYLYTGTGCTGMEWLPSATGSVLPHFRWVQCYHISGGFSFTSFQVGSVSSPCRWASSHLNSDGFSPT